MKSLTKKLQGGGGNARKLGWLVEIKISWQWWLLIGEMVAKKMCYELCGIAEANGCKKIVEAISCRKKTKWLESG